MTTIDETKSPGRILKRFFKSLSTASLLAVGLVNVGCTSLTQPLSGIPVRRLPPQFLAQSKNNFVPLDPSRLTQEPPRQYLIDKGDILGIYIDGVLPFTDTNKPAEPPPVHFPERDSLLDPSLGFPIAVQENGTISLPSIEPVKVKGMTTEQITEVIRKAYLDAKVFSDPKRLRPLVTLMKERTYEIVVVRQDIASSQSQLQAQTNTRQGGYSRGADQSASGSMIKLPAYQNDVLHALMASGGLPGVNAKNEVKILRSSKADLKKRDEFIQQFYQQYYCNPDPCGCPPPIPDDPSVLKIPMRLPPGVIPSFTIDDIILEEGDVVYIESREAEVFYTGGLLPGGEWLIPRDYDLDVLGAMGLAGAGVGSMTSRGGSFGINSIGGVPPGMLYILRKTPCNGQITIEVDIARASQDPRERPLIMPGDTLILRYKPSEELLNFGIGSFFTFGLQALLQGINR
ncbi:MAG: polysaccharide biosynthesis/export family protein [Pirellula sp.]